MSQTDKMTVSIEFLGRQRAVTKKHKVVMPITNKTRVNDALEYVRDRYPELHLDEGMTLITVNHKIAPLDRLLRDNDTISFLPFISGG